jgi:hypothetical protein
MRNRGYTDAEYEVISGPVPVRWSRRRRKPGDPMAPFRWLFFGLLGFAVLMTVIAGLAGGDIDTTDDRAPAVAVAHTSAGLVPVQTVEPPAGNVRDQLAQ